MIQADQIRGARAMLKWGQERLAAAAGISIVSVKRLEAGNGVHSSTLAAVQAAIEKAGVLFLEPGVSRPGGRGLRLKR